MIKDIDMRKFARGAGTTIGFQPGTIVFNKGDAGQCMYIVQSGVIEMMIGDKVIEVVGPNEAIGFMSMIDDHPRSSTRAGEGNLRAFSDRRPHISIHGRRSAEFRALYHECAGAPYPRYGRGDEISGLADQALTKRTRVPQGSVVANPPGISVNAVPAAARCFLSASIVG